MAKQLAIKHQLRFLDMLNALLQNGFSIVESMQLISQLREKDHFITQIRLKLDAGESFATGISSYFPTDVVNQIQIAEQHGQLIATLREVQLFINERNKQQTKLKGLLLYPMFLMALLMIITVGVKIFVTPQLNLISAGTVDSKQPQWGWWLTGPALLIIIGFGVIWLRQQTPVQRAEFFARLPLIGGIVRAYYAYFFASNIALLLASGLEAKSIARLLQKFPVNSIFNAIGVELAVALQGGASIHGIIEQHAFLPNEAALFFDRGDQIHVVAKKLAIYAKLSFDKMWLQSQRLIAAVQPVIFVVIGAVIVLTYLNMLLPMYDTLSEVYK